MSTRTSGILWAVLAIALLAFGVFEAVKYGWVAAGVFVLFLLLPDVALIGAFDARRRGALLPSRVAFYNALHQPWLPLAMMLAAMVVPLPVLGLGLRGGLELFLAGLGWLTHVAADRAFGYGLRAPDGTIRGQAPAQPASDGERSPRAD